MEERIKSRFSQKILTQAIGRYGIANNKIRLLDGFESFIYEYQQESREYILRISHSFRRSTKLIEAEVDWINYLAAGGASVSQAIHSQDGNLVEKIPDERGENFLVTAFKKAPGKPPSAENWNHNLFERYGQLLGRMHVISKSYTPPNPGWQRPHWDSPEMLEIDRILPDSESQVLKKYNDLVKYLHKLPRDNRESYGLIHQDAHAGNFFVDQEGRITLFDFDDCAYSWYMNDIAIVLFYAVMGEQDEGAFSEAFLTHFLAGYQRENGIWAEWLSKIPYFLKLREIDLYAVIHRSFDVKNLEDPWCRRYMEGRKERITDEIPYINYNFETFSKRFK